MTGAEGVCGGISTHNKNVIRGLQNLARDFDLNLRVLSLHESEADRPGYLDKKYRFAGCGGSKYRFASGVALRAAIDSLVIVDHVTLALPALPFAYCKMSRLVVFAHGSEADDRMKSTSPTLFRMARRVLTNSHLTLRRLLLRVPEAKAVVCSLGLSPNMPLRNEVQANGNQQLLLTACDGKERMIGDRSLLLVARMDSTELEKGHDALIRALPQIHRRFPTVQLVFPGPGDGREALVNLSHSLNVAHAVFIPGFVSDEMLQHLYQHCFSFVMPSKQEGFGLVYLEAMNYGKACLGCYDDGAEAVIVPGETGVLIHEPSNASELAAAICYLLEDPARTAAFGYAGFRRLHDNFTATMHQQRVYENVAACL